MDQYKHHIRVRRDSGIPYKRDTPVRTSTKRRERYHKLLASKHYDPLPEKPEEEEINESIVKPVSASVPCLSSSGFTENRRRQPAPCVTPVVKAAGHQQFSGEVYPKVQVTLIPEVLKSLGTPESGTSCIMEADSTLNSEEEEEDVDDDHIYCSASTTLSSSTSPEIFRKEISVDIMTFPNKDELLGLHLQVKNSTLLEDSHAENIHTHHPPNLSTIIDVSTNLAEQKCEISYHKNPEDEDQAFKRNTPPKLSERKPILYRKKVWFKSPVTTELQKVKDITSSTVSNKTSNYSNPPQKIKPHPMTSRTNVINVKDETLPFALTLKRPVKTCSEKAMFFHFVNASEGEAFFQKMRERSVKLGSAVFFPLKSGMQNSES